jgi:hypothetical protein
VKNKQRVDLLIRFDPDRQSLLFYDVTSEISGGTIKAVGRTPKSEFSVETTKAKGPSEAERAIGACVFAFIDFHNIEKIGLRDYAQMLEEDVSQRRGAAGNGDADAQFELAMDHVSKAMKKYSRADIQKAETYLRWASEHGSAEAVEYLRDQWPRIKAHLERKGQP